MPGDAPGGLGEGDGQVDGRGAEVAEDLVPWFLAQQHAHTVRRPLEDLHAELRLHPGQGARKRRLRGAQGGSRIGDVLVVGNGDQPGQAAQLHAAMIRVTYDVAPIQALDA